MIKFHYLILRNINIIKYLNEHRTNINKTNMVMHTFLINVK